MMFTVSFPERREMYAYFHPYHCSHFLFPLPTVYKEPAVIKTGVFRTFWTQVLEETSCRKPQLCAVRQTDGNYVMAAVVVATTIARAGAHRLDVPPCRCHGAR